ERSSWNVDETGRDIAVTKKTNRLGGFRAWDHDRKARVRVAVLAEDEEIAPFRKLEPQRPIGSGLAGETLLAEIERIALERQAELIERDVEGERLSLELEEIVHRARRFRGAGDPFEL